MGELLAQHPKQHDARGVGKSGVEVSDSTPPTLREMGISKDESMNPEGKSAVVT